MFGNEGGTTGIDDDFVAGMIVGTVFTLFVVPAFDSLIAKERASAHPRIEHGALRLARPSFQASR